ncbi:MAG: cache domain-containing protein [Oceanospirillaceae bacterium]
MLLMAAMLIVLLYFWTNQVSYRQLLMKASTDLAVANQGLRSTQKDYYNQLVINAQQQQLATFIQIQPQFRDTDKYQQQLQEKLLQIKNSAQLNFIRLLDKNHCPMFSSAPCRTFSSKLVAKASHGDGGSGVEIFSTLQLKSIAAPLAERAKVTIKNTAQAVSAQKTIEDRAMVLHLAYPLLDAKGEVSAILSAGILMNRNNDFVDQIKQTVYGEGSLHTQSLGTVTIFLDDVRISTNVPDAEQTGGRAIGTKVSKQVRQKVLLQGERWLDRAFVVSDWYISGYSPIVDSGGARVGMIYAGFLEAPFRQEFYNWLWQLLALVIVVLISCTFVVIHGAKGIFGPVETMVDVITAIRRGLRKRIHLSPNTSPELQTLAKQFNLMLNQLEQQHDQIEQEAGLLEVKVLKRTESLNQHIKLLKRTREQLIAQEKLAVIGQLTAGIAHEINNPTAVILGHLDLMTNELQGCGFDVQSDIEVMVCQVKRIQSLITDLLLLSRPNINLQPGSRININELINATSVLVKHDLHTKNITLSFDLRATAAVLGNRQKIQQVLINLLINAIAASENSAKIKISTRHWQSSVILLVTDTGCGMSKTILERIFDPFFSRTAGGTGLGLSISYSLLQSQQAQISVHSKPNQGSTFCLWLPLA